MLLPFKSLPIRIMDNILMQYMPPRANFRNSGSKIWQNHKMQHLAPDLWDMLGLMLSANQCGMCHTGSFNDDTDQLMMAAEEDEEEH